MGRRLAVLVDFDDTAAEHNVAEAMLERFCDWGWRGLRERFQARSLTLREYQEQAFNRIGATLEEMEGGVEGLVRLRDGIEGLASYCKANAIQMAIVTNSLDFYVRAALRPTSLRGTPVFAVGVAGSPGRLAFTYPHAAADCLQPGWGNCKCRVMDGFRRNGSRIVYVGDGRSDLCASQRADFVFARASLLEHCRALGLLHQSFADFNDVVATLEGGIPGIWEPPSAGAV